MRLDDGSNDLAAAFGGNVAPALLQFFARNRKNAVAFAECGPVQAVRLIQQDLVLQRRPAGALGGAIDDFHKIFSGCPGRV